MLAGLGITTPSLLGVLKLSLLGYKSKGILRWLKRQSFSGAILLSKRQALKRIRM